MARYFLQVYYKGTHYSGFQIQKNANSVQAELEKCLKTFFREAITLTCSSRTDAGVHALNNYFHFDSLNMPGPDLLNRSVYNLNAMLPGDIVVKGIYPVPETAHARFSATSRFYRYYIYQQKDPFLADRAFFVPYDIDRQLLNEAASLVAAQIDFSSFSKKNTQVKTFLCEIYQSRWIQENGMLVYEVAGNRFLRGMVRGLVGTMLRVGMGKISVAEFKEIMDKKNAALADFSVPPQALFLMAVNYPPDLTTYLSS